MILDNMTCSVVEFPVAYQTFRIHRNGVEVVFGIDLLLGQRAVPYAHLGHITGEETVGVVGITDPESTVVVALGTAVCHT